jgi:hypothetical protein
MYGARWLETESFSFITSLFDFVCTQLTIKSVESSSILFFLEFGEKTMVLSKRQRDPSTFAFAHGVAILTCQKTGTSSNRSASTNSEQTFFFQSSGEVTY